MKLTRAQIEKYIAAAEVTINKQIDDRDLTEIEARDIKDWCGDVLRKQWQLAVRLP